MLISLPSSVNGVQVKLDFQVLAPPAQLRGIEVIWRVFQDCDKKNKELTNVIGELITKLYLNITEQIPREEVERMQDEFCGTWLEQLRRVTSTPGMGEEDKKLFVVASINLLKSFLGDCERNGIGQLRIHDALNRGDLIENVVIQNQITTAKHMPKFIELRVYSNMSLWELKVLAAKQFNVSPLRFELRRADTKRQAFDDLSNAKLLRDLKIENFEIIHAQRKPI